MGDIVFCCQHCRESLIVEDSGVGMRVPCPRCGQSIEIPATAIPAETVQHLVLSEQVGALPEHLGHSLREDTAARALDPTSAPSVPPPHAQDLSSSSVRYAAVDIPSRRGLLAILVMLGLITVGLMLALYVQSKTGFTPPDVPPDLDKPRLAEVEATPNQAVALGPVILLAHRGLLGKGLGGTDTNTVSFVVDFSIENASKAPCYLAYTWNGLRAVDQNGHHIQPLEAGVRHAVQKPIELAPGAVQRVPAVFGPIPDGSTTLSLRGAPGIWRKNSQGEYTEWNLPEISLSFARTDLERASAVKATPGNP